MENDSLKMLAQVVLPSQILEYFAVVGVEQTPKEIRISLDERMNKELSSDVHFESKGYQTNNRWTFLKLDTRTGVIAHVQYSTDGDAMQYELNSEPLSEGEDAKPGRFFLYPTENTYNFILLDQIDGRVWQVQWNIDKENRGIWRIY